MGFSRLKSAASVFVAASLWVSAIFSGTSNAETPNPHPNHMPSRQTILDCAKRYTGFDESYNVEKIEAVPLSELSIPFLSSKLKGQTGICVRFAPGKIKWLPPLNETEDPYERHVSIYLDAEAKRFVAVTIRLAARPADIQVLPLEEQEKRLRGSDVSYDLFPTPEPKVSFLQALATVNVKGFGKPLKAREIDGFYLNLTFPIRKSAGTTRWMIIMRGLPRMRMPGFGETTSITNVVNPFTGAWVGSRQNSGPGF